MTEKIFVLEIFGRCCMSSCWQSDSGTTFERILLSENRHHIKQLRNSHRKRISFTFLSLDVTQENIHTRNCPVIDTQHHSSHTSQQLRERNLTLTMGKHYLRLERQNICRHAPASKHSEKKIRVKEGLNRTEQDQKDLSNLPLYRAVYFYIVMCSLWK